MESSRLFVKNLPPTITEPEFRKHFSAKGRQVTDVKLIAKRRIGYVGYKTADEAAKAVKYFNRSYIRMSKISVELAKAISDPSLPTARKIGHVQNVLPALEPEAEPKSKDAKLSGKKRKRDDSDKSDPKLKEYLDTMQSGVVSSNALEGIFDQLPISEDSEMAKLPVGGESDDDYETLPAQQPKRQKGDKEQAVPEVHEPPTLPAEEPVEQTPKPVPHTAFTDDDWLRSRTSRLLDLVDPDDTALVVRSDDEPSNPPQQAGIDAGVPPPETVVGTGPPPSSAHDEKPGTADDQDYAVEQIRRTSRLYVRNLPFQATEDDLRDYFVKFGEIEEVHVPVDRSGTSKGFALISFSDPTAAIAAFQDADGKPFQGRILHILPAQPKKERKFDEFAISQLPLKKQNLIRKKAEASSTTFNWNSLYMNQDAVLASTADRLGISKSELLDPTSADAAVKHAVAETQIIQETKSYFALHGVNLDAFKSQNKGDTAILVKNFPFGTTMEELRRLFEEATGGGGVLQVLMPLSGTIAVVQFSQPVAARAAFAKLAYRRIKDSVLFLEKAPTNLFVDENQQAAAQPQARPTGVQKTSVADLLDRKDDQDQPDTASLYVRNLNFDTTRSQLADAFKPLDGFIKAQVKTKLDPKKPGQVLSMGFGFVHFKSKAQAEAALKVMDGFVLQSHVLAVKLSHKGLDAAEERRREDKAKKSAGQRTKIVIKNLAFEASKADLRRLLGTYGQLRVVRIPKKFGNSSRGFAFAEFTSPRDAENCINSLKDTHLLGRRLVLDYAEAEAVDAEEEIAKMQRKIGGQVNKIALQQLTGRGKQKLDLGEDNDEGA